MSLFTTLFSWGVQEKPAPKPETVVLVGSIKYDLGIMGEDHHQAAFETICGPRRSRGVRRYETARLVPEDKQAVRVEIHGKRVGYLRPEHAILFRQQMREQGIPNPIGQCQALITGGWLSSDGRKGDYEVWLDLPSLYQ